MSKAKAEKYPLKGNPWADWWAGKRGVPAAPECRGLSRVDHAIPAGGRLMTATEAARVVLPPMPDGEAWRKPLTGLSIHKAPERYLEAMGVRRVRTVPPPDPYHYSPGSREEETERVRLGDYECGCNGTSPGDLPCERHAPAIRDYTPEVKRGRG